MNRGRQVIYQLLRWLFFLVSLAYLARFAYTSFDFRQLASWFTADSSLSLLLAAMLFATTAVFSVVGWRILLAHLGHPQPFTAVAYAFCVTQIAKYLPGNVGHHVGRVTIAKSHLGIPSGVTLVAILQESALACLGALLVSALSVMTVPEGSFSALQREAVAGSGLSLFNALFLIIVVGLAALSAINALKRHSALARSRVLIWLFGVAPEWRPVLSALPAYAAIYVVNGFALWLVADSLMEVSAKDFLIMTGAYSLSWAIGFLLPGAPGGLGVREAALTMLLTGTYSPEAIFSLSILSRIATVVADLVIFLFGLFMSRHLQKSGKQSLTIKGN